MQDGQKRHAEDKIHLHNFVEQNFSVSIFEAT